MIKEDFCWCFRGIEESYQLIKKNQNDNICVDFFFDRSQTCFTEAFFVYFFVQLTTPNTVI